MTKRKKDITGYEYDELMSTLRVSVSKHFLDESFSLVWANDYYYELIRYTKEEYEEKFYNNPQLYYTYHHFEIELEKIREAVIEAFATGKHGYTIMTRMPTNGGSLSLGAFKRQLYGRIYRWEAGFLYGHERY